MDLMLEPRAGVADDALLESVPVGVAAFDRQLQVVLWNRALEALTGVAAAGARGRLAAELPVLTDCGLLDALVRALCGDETTADDVPVPGVDGRPQAWVSVRFSPRRARGGECAGVVAVFHDVTARRQAEDETRRLAAFPRESPFPVIECDGEGSVRYANPATHHVLAEIGQGLDRFLPRNHHQLAAAALQHGQALRTVEVNVDDRVFSWTYHPHPQMGVVHLFADDITARRAVEDQLRHDALHDGLTGLPNRHLFLERLARAILQEKRRPGYLFAVLFLDLDRFKVVNDGLGHHVGDELLVAVASRLRGCLRETDTVARFGGDEFAVLLDDIGTVETAVRAAERIQAALSAPVSLSGYEVFTSASIGIALSSDAWGRPEHLLRNADMAMYRAKAAGTGRHEVFDRAMHALALTRLQMETDLRRGVERQEFSLHYQPIVNLRTGRIAGVEALLRWQHPERGWIAPADFVPAAEETGIILGMGRRVVSEACRQMREWQDAAGGPRPLAVSVNLSVKQFAQADLVEQVREALDESGLDPRLLRLEVTESVIVENVEAAAATLRRLKTLGIQLYLDDFGTGYSSLSALHRLPIDALKVDRSFVSGLGREEGATQMVRVVTTLARNLDLAVVAEGVEDAGQLAQLRRMGCDYAQGFHIAHPMAPDDLRALLAENPRW